MWPMRNEPSSSEKQARFREPGLPTPPVRANFEEMETRKTLVAGDQYMIRAGVVYLVRVADMRIFRLGRGGARAPVSDREARATLALGRPISDAEATVMALADAPAPVGRAHRLREAWERLPHRNAVIALGGMFLLALLSSALLNSGMGIFAETLLLIAVMPVVVFSAVFVAVAAGLLYYGLLYLYRRLLG